MAYVVKKSNNSTLTTVSDNTIDTGSCSLALLGRGSTNYGNHVAQNFVWLLENFANSSAPDNPLTGQLWYDTGTEVMKYYTGAEWKVIGTGSGMGGEVTIGGNVVSVLISNNNVIGAVSHATISNASLPNNITIAGTSYTFKTRFPNGLGPGLTLATDANDYKFRGTATAAEYADLAERYAASELLVAGDVVEMGGPLEIRKTREAYTTNVFGVISASPAFAMNSGAGTDETHPYVAFSGRVPCKVRGKVFKGDRLVASEICGVAMSVGPTPSADMVWSVFGRALADKTDDGVGLVEIVVGVK